MFQRVTRPRGRKPLDLLLRLCHVNLKPSYLYEEKSVLLFSSFFSLDDELLQTRKKVHGKKHLPKPFVLGSTHSLVE